MIEKNGGFCLHVFAFGQDAERLLERILAREVAKVLDGTWKASPITRVK